MQRQYWWAAEKMKPLQKKTNNKAANKISVTFCLFKRAWSHGKFWDRCGGPAGDWRSVPASTVFMGKLNVFVMSAIRHWNVCLRALVLCLGRLAGSRGDRDQVGCVEGPGSRQRGTVAKLFFSSRRANWVWVFLFFCDGWGWGLRCHSYRLGVILGSPAWERELRE